MRLNVTTERGVYRLTAIVVAATLAVSFITAHLLIVLIVPAGFSESRHLLLNAGYAVSAVTSMVVAMPFAFLIGRSLLQAHLLQQRIISQASTDELTGLPNRATVLANIERAVSAGVASGRNGAALFVDLDHFKKINDTHGHGVGDAALRHAADIMRATLGAKAIMGRFGGEEFVCFIEDAEKAPAVAASIIIALREKSLHHGDQVIPVKASIGLARTDGTGDVNQLLSRADEALYIAKASGRDCIVSHDEVALLRRVAASIDKPLRRRSTDTIHHLSQQAA